MSRKQLTPFIAIDKTQAFKQKIRILENLCIYYKLNSFPTLRHCSDENKVFLILYNKMCQQFKDQKFPNDQGMMLQNHACVKHLFKVHVDQWVLI